MRFNVLQEFDLNSIHRKLRYSHIEIGLTHLAGLLSSDFSPRIDPFKEYFANLPPWDCSTDHIAQLAATVTLRNVDHAEIFRTYLKKWLVAAVGCAIDPETVNHNCLVLVGPQGRYKTTWLNMLVPKPLSNYVRVGTIDPSDKDTEIHLSECFLINLDELETLNKHELGTLKSIMTYKTSRLRRPYAHFAETLIRRASFAGSINRDSFLTDETGTRRFLVVEIESINAAHGIDMDKVHAQAYFLFRTGFRHWFDRNEIVAINELNREFSLQTTEDELVAQYCVSSSSTVEWLTATQVANRIAVRTTYKLVRSSARDFGFALKKAGYPSKKLDGITRYAVEVGSSFTIDPTSSGVKSGVGSGVASSEPPANQLF
jgi:predicted P-loop ATPase